MSDWKEITDIEKITLQPLLKLSSDQYGITLIIHLIFTILNSFQPFFCAGVSILASCSVSAPTPLSLRVCPEQKAQLLGADSFELPSTSNPASVSPHYKWKNQLEARKLWVSAQRLWQDSSRYYAVTEESWALEEPNMLTDGEQQRIMCASAPVQVFVALAWVAYLQNPNPLTFFPFLLSI